VADKAILEKDPASRTFPRSEKGQASDRHQGEPGRGRPLSGHADEILEVVRAGSAIGRSAL